MRPPAAVYPGGSDKALNPGRQQTRRHIHERHDAWEGFDRDAMYKQLDAIEKEAAAARARKAADRAAAEQAATAGSS